MSSFTTSSIVWFGFAIAGPFFPMFFIFSMFFSSGGVGGGGGVPGWSFSSASIAAWTSASMSAWVFTGRSSLVGSSAGGVVVTSVSGPAGVLGSFGGSVVHGSLGGSVGFVSFGGVTFFGVSPGHGPAIDSTALIQSLKSRDAFPPILPVLSLLISFSFAAVVILLSFVDVTYMYPTMSIR